MKHIDTSPFEGVHGAGHALEPRRQEPEPQARPPGGPHELARLREDMHGALAPRFHYPVARPGMSARLIHDDVVVVKDPFCDRAEEFRQLRSELLSTFSRVGRRALAVLSQDDGDGRSYLAANLAASFSQLGGRTLLVDANMRRPALHRLFGVEARAGLADLLAGDEEEEDVVVPVPGLEKLHLMQAGSPVAEPLELLQGPRLGVLMHELLHRFDYVIADTASNAAAPDSRVIAVEAGAALVVGRRGRTRVRPVRKLLAQLASSPTMVVGVVLNEH